MAAASLMQIVALGPQDEILTANPTIDFFNQNYEQHVNFGFEQQEITFNGHANFGREVNCTLPKAGDLVNDIWLEISLPALEVDNTSTIRWVDNIGHIIIDYITIDIGGNRIDKHYGIYYELWKELTIPEEKRLGFNDLIGQQNVVEDIDSTGVATYSYEGLQTPAQEQPATILNIPLQFWFNTNVGLALPLISIQYQNVKFEVKLRAITDLVIMSSGAVFTAPILTDLKMWATYIYLDQDMRAGYTSNEQTYLITQLQTPGAESVSASSYNYKISLNHPIIELIWFIQEDSAETANDWCNFSTSTGASPVTDVKISINNQDKEKVRLSSYYQKIIPYLRHTRMPSKHIFVYTFSLFPEVFQPSGSMNYSRIDTCTIHHTLSALSSSTAGKIHLFARNYNELRITCGGGNVGYSS